MSLLLPASLNSRIKFPYSFHKPAKKPTFSIANSLHFKCPTSLFPPPNESVAAIVLGDGSYSRLYPLTKRRSEAAIPIAGNYRLIDAVMSNCINSSITRIYILTQFNSTSLNSHLSRAYSGMRLGKQGSVEVIAAYQSPEGKGWFQGTADAIRRCLWLLDEYPGVEFLVLPGHHLYKMDYQRLIEVHRDNKADITVSVLDKLSNEDLGFGVFQLNANDNRVIRYRENIKSEENFGEFNDMAQNCFPSMGIYVINRKTMKKLLTEYFPLANDLRSEVIPSAMFLGMKIHAYKFDGCWEDMRSVGAYYRANMESTKKANKVYNFYDRDSPLYTLPRHLPPTQITDALITDSIIGDGCILNKCKIKGTVIGMRTRVNDRATIEDSVIMGSDGYNHITDMQNGAGEEESINIPVGIGEGSHIRKAIIDKNARIGKDVMIINKDNVQEGNREENGYIITEGIIVVLRSAVIPNGSIV